MKSITSCRAGNCTRFAGFLCPSCGRMFCGQHFNKSKGQCLSCAAQSAGYGGCVAALVGLAVLIGIVVFIIVPKNSGQPSSPTPKIEQEALSADRSGNTSVGDENGHHGVVLTTGASVTFHLKIQNAGSYYMCFSGDDVRIDNTPGAPASDLVTTIDLIVNGKLNNQIVDYNPRVTPLWGSHAEFSCVSDFVAQLNSGANTIQFKIDEKSQCGSFACPGELVEGIQLDEKA